MAYDTELFHNLFFHSVHCHHYSGAKHAVCHFWGKTQQVVSDTEVSQRIQQNYRVCFHRNGPCHCLFKKVGLQVWMPRTQNTLRLVELIAACAWPFSETGTNAQAVMNPIKTNLQQD
jgi:hypothetical protein